MADMARRRASSGSQPESKKRKLNYAVEEESDSCPSIDFPCNFCSAVFVTQISLSRHVLTFHEGQTLEKEEYAVKEDLVEEAQDNNFDELENQYFDNEAEYYYEEEEGNGDNGSAGLEDFLEPILNSNEFVATQNGVNGTNPPSSYLRPRSQSRSATSPKTSKPQLNSKDLASVLAQVEEITSVTESDFVTCPLCRKTFGRKELPIHVACEHGGAKFTCPYCGRNISRRDHLKRHIKNVHPEMCTETEIGPFPRNLNLSRSTTINPSQKQPTQANTVSFQQSPKIKEESLNPMKPLPISIVAPRLLAKEEEEDEEDDFEGEDDLAQNNGYSEDGQEEDEDESMQITVEPDLPFQDLSDYNEDMYHTPSFLLDSLDQYQDKVPSMSGGSFQGTSAANMAYQCSLCNAVFSSKALLDRHESTHSELRPHKCSICNKGFLRKEHLSKHLSSVHSGMKFTCEFCGKDISRKDHLIRHIRNVHPTQFYSISELPQDAEQDLYTQAQIQTQQLQIQLQTAALKTAQSLQPKPKKPFFNCDMCEATFINVDDLHAHQSTIHSDVRKYKCNYCCKAFKRKEHLTKHEVLHTGERKFTCRVCGNEFLRKDALQEHIKRTHGIDTNGSGTPPTNGSNGHVIATIPCNLCDQLFQDRGSLLSHMTSVHGLIVNSPPGLPKSSQRPVTTQSAPQQRQIQAKPAMSARNGTAGTKSVPPINGSNLGSLMDLINKGSITLSYHPIKSE